MFLRPRMTRTGGHAGPYVWGGVTGVTNSDNPWLTAVQENTATRLVVAGSSYDAEQRFLVNENPLSVRTALGVGLGSAGCAGPVFAPDKYGPAMWLDQTSVAAHVKCTVPALTSGTAYTVEGKGRWPLDSVTRRIWMTGSLQLYMNSGTLHFWDSTAQKSAASTLQTLIGIASWDLLYWQIVVSGTSLTVNVSNDGSSWTPAISTTITSYSISGQTMYTGSSSTSSPGRGNWHFMSLRNGGTGALKVAEFSPGIFVGGNRANGDTAVDAYGVTWTITRPAATTDMPRVMVGRTEQYISLPGGSGEYITTPDTAALSITGDITLMAKFRFDGTPATSYYLVNKGYNAAGRLGYSLGFTNNGRVFARHSADGSTNCGGTYFSDAGDLEAAVGTGVDVAVAAVITVDDGAGGSTYDFYYSTDDGVTWNDLALNRTATGANGAIYDNAEPLEIGSYNSGANNLYDGYVYWAEVRSGASLTGTLIERIDAAEANPNSTTWTSSTSGATVTVNKSASAQYHATVVPAGTTIVQGDGVNDFAQVVGDDTITDFDPGVGLTLVLDARVPVADAWGTLFADWSGSDGLQSYLVDANPRVASYLHDSVTATAIGDNADNITYGSRFLFAAAHGDSDHEAYVDGASVEATTIALVAIPAANPLRFFARPNGTNPAAFDLYGAAVLGERTSDTEAAAYNTEGLVR